MTPLHHWLSEPGFFGTGAARGSDLLVCGLLILVVLVTLGLRAARRGHFQRHALLMATSSFVLGAVVVVFTSWTRAGGPRGGSPMPQDLMGLHLGLASTTLIALPFTLGTGLLALAYRKGRSPHAGRPRRHRALGFFTAGLFAATAFTGLLVYALKYLGF